MDRTGVIAKGKHCEISFYFLRERFRVTLPGFLYERASDRKSAQQKLAVVKREIQLGTFDFAKHFPEHPAARRFIKGHQILLRDALKEWLLSKRKDIEPTTYSGYEKAVRYHLIPEFGDIYLSDLQPSNVKEWLADWDASGKTKNNTLTPLRGVFREAYLNERVDRDPMERVPRVPHTYKEPNPLSRAEIEAVLAAASGQIRNILQFAIGSGLRTSELIAIRWEDIDLDRNEIHVRMTRTHAGEKDYGKTETSTRRIHLEPPAREALENQRPFTEGKRFVFDNPHTGEPWRHDGPYRKIAWIPTLKKAGVRHRPAYQTRHTFASMLVSHGIEPMYVAAQLGHRDSGMVRKVYGRWLPEFSKAQQERSAVIWTLPGR